MTAAFPTILAVLIGLTFEEFYAESALPTVSAWRLLLVLPACLLPILMAEAVLFAAGRRFDRRRPFEHARFARLVAVSPLPVYVLILFALGWPAVLVPLSLERTFLIDHLIILLPYLLLFLGATVESMRLQRPLRVTPRGARPTPIRDVRPRALEALRQLLLVLVPLMGLLLALDLVRDTGLRLYFHNLPILSTAFLGLAFLGLSAAFPMIVRYALPTRSLLHGAPLRRHLERQSARLDFTCRDILMWTTRRPVLNAAIVGVLPRMRYVLLTAELCRQLTLDELGAVFAHEVGHGKRHHAWYYTLFSIAFFTLLSPISNAVGRLVEVGSGGEIEASIAGALIVFLPAFAAYWLALFGFLSRRFELEADVYGAESSRDPRLFIDTLEKVARLARIRRRARASWHFSIAGRSDFLRRAFLEGDRRALDGFKERIRRVKRAILVGGAVVLGCAAMWLSFDSLRGVGAILLEVGRREQARSVLSTVVRIDGDDPVALTLLGEIELYRETSPDLDTGRSWSRVAASSGDLLRQERGAVLDALRVGWSRVLADPRPDLARVLIDRMRLLNGRVGDSAEPGTARVFDAALDRDLEEMTRVTEAVAADDVALLRGVLGEDPRWLRRLDARAAREFLERFVRGDPAR